MNLPRPEPFETAFSYSDPTSAPQYHCGKCGAHGVKLWREYQVMLPYQSLLCAYCACVEQDLEHQKVGTTFGVEQDSAGRVCVTAIYNAELDPKLHKIYGGSDRGGDQIGWRIPAVPTEDGSTYWGYTSVPVRGVMWWCRLPLTRSRPCKP